MLLIEQFKRTAPPRSNTGSVCISHTDCESEAKLLAEMLKKSTDVQKVSITLMSPIIGAHLGPGSIVLAFESGMSRREYENKFYS
jgi:fatty acid-binding protein DegV